MSEVQNPTTDQNSTANKDEKVGDYSLSLLQQSWIDYKAIGGWITDADTNVPKKMTVTEFANRIGVNRDTLYDWTTRIPNFWQRVADRRREIGSQERLIKIHDTWYLKALGGSFPHLQLWLANFDPNFRMPQQEMKHELGDSWMALAQSKAKLIDAEIPDASENNAA